MKIFKWFSGWSTTARMITTVLAGALIITSCVWLGLKAMTDADKAASSSLIESVDSIDLGSNSVEESTIDSSNKDSLEAQSSIEESAADESSVESSSEGSSEDSESTEESSSGTSSESSESADLHEHDFSVTLALSEFLHEPATCESAASYYYSCSCGERGKETFSYGTSLQHNVEVHSAKAPTCVDIGWNAYVTCKRAGCTYTTYEEKPATGEHTWDNGEITTESTCISEGVKTFTCTVCLSASYEEELPTISEHTWGDPITTKPTCVKQGYDTTTCIFCGEVEKGNYTPVGDHAWDWAYSCDDTYHWFVCNTCEETTGMEEHTDDGNGVCCACGRRLPFTVGLVYTLSADGTYAIVTEYDGTATEVKIADKYKGVPVTQIVGWAFYNDTAIQRVVIGENVTLIGNNAFNNCTSLTEIVISDSVKKIDSRAFLYCINLQEITIGKGVQWLGKEVFYGCEKLQKIIFADTSSWYWTTSNAKWEDRHSGSIKNVQNATTNVDVFLTHVDYYWYKL